MTARMTVVATALALFLFHALTPPPAAVAQSKAEKLIEKARGLAERGSSLEAATTYGEALAAAQKKGDLLVEQDAAWGLDELLNGVRQEGVTVTTGWRHPDGERERDLLAAVMEQLDPVHPGAYVSARVLARELLICCVAAGDDRHLADAAAVLREHDGRKGSGRAGTVLARLAEGVAAARAGTHADAGAPLEKALAGALAEGWTDLACHAGTELAAAALAADDTDRARSAMERTAAGFDLDAPSAVLTRWSLLAKARLPGAPQEVLAPLVELEEKRGRSVRSPGVSTGLPDSGLGRAKSTDLGREIKRFSASKPLVEVRRDALFEIETKFAPGRKLSEAHPGLPRFVEEGGLALFLYRHQVGLAGARLENSINDGLGQGLLAVDEPARSRSVARALYLLGRKEAWSVTKKGVVAIH